MPEKYRNVKSMRKSASVVCGTRSHESRIGPLKLFGKKLQSSCRCVTSKNFDSSRLERTIHHVFEVSTTRVKEMRDAMNETNAALEPLWLNDKIFTLFYRLGVGKSTKALSVSSWPHYRLSALCGRATTLASYSSANDEAKLNIEILFLINFSNSRNFSNCPNFINFVNFSISSIFPNSSNLSNSSNCSNFLNFSNFFNSLICLNFPNLLNFPSVVIFLIFQAANFPNFSIFNIFLCFPNFLNFSNFEFSVFQIF